MTNIFRTGRVCYVKTGVWHESTSGAAGCRQIGYIPSPPIILCDLIIIIILDEANKLCSSSLRYFLQPPLMSSLRSKYSPQHLVPKHSQPVRFEVLTAASTKMAVFWVVAPCSLVKVYQTARRNNPEESHFHPQPVFFRQCERLGFTSIRNKR
jgi:hypothetical protein